MRELRVSPLRGPSALEAPRCRWGMTLSSTSKNAIPTQNPTNAGTQAMRPMPPLLSMAGMMSDQMDAATMTPAAKPVRMRLTVLLRLPRMRKTIAAPAVVPKSGRPRPTKRFERESETSM